jgi:hypothetical protein
MFATIVRGDQEGLFKLVTLDRILNRITGVTSGCWWRASSCRDKPSNENLEQNAHARVHILRDNFNEQSFSNISTG